MYKVSVLDTGLSDKGTDPYGTCLVGQKLSKHIF